MLIVVSSLTNDTVDPIEMARWSYENGYWCSGSGSYHALIPAAAKAWGLNVEGCSASDGQKIADALADGKLVVAIMLKGHSTSSGHFTRRFYEEVIYRSRTDAIQRKKSGYALPDGVFE